MEGANGYLSYLRYLAHTNVSGGLILPSLSDLLNNGLYPHYFYNLRSRHQEYDMAFKRLVDKLFGLKEPTEVDTLAQFCVISRVIFEHVQEDERMQRVIGCALIKIYKVKSWRDAKELITELFLENPGDERHPFRFRLKIWSIERIRGHQMPLLDGRFMPNLLQICLRVARDEPFGLQITQRTEMESRTKIIELISRKMYFVAGLPKSSDHGWTGKEYSIVSLTEAFQLQEQFDGETSVFFRAAVLWTTVHEAFHSVLQFFLLRNRPDGTLTEKKFLLEKAKRHGCRVEELSPDRLIEGGHRAERLAFKFVADIEMVIKHHQELTAWNPVAADQLAERLRRVCEAVVRRMFYDEPVPDIDGMWMRDSFDNSTLGNYLAD